MPKSIFASQPRTVLPGSQKQPFGGKPGKAASPASSLTVSVVLRRKAPLDPAKLGETRLTRAQYRASHGADPAALKAVLAFAKEFDLAAVNDPPRRTVQLTVTVANMQRAFGVTLAMQTAADGQTYRVREGDITLPDALHGLVEAVLGLDNRPQAKPHFRIAPSAPAKKGVAKPRATNVSYTPVQVAELYGQQANASGAGQTIGLIELGGGYKTADIKTYFKALNLPVPNVVAVSVDKGRNKPSGPNGADGEVMLDIELAAAVAPGVKIVVYFAPNTDQGFIDAISTAVHDSTHNPSVISISWGGPEDSWTQQSLTALDQACQSAAALGITVLAAAGDNGSSDGETDGKNHVDFPASSPHVLACGGTKLVGSGTSIQSEVVWNETAANEGATGGGVSTIFPQPSWQSGIAATKAGRGVPDVAGDADPATGYQVRVDGEALVIGGTSAVAPLWAAILATINAHSKTTVGFIQPRLYASGASASFRDITQGNNGAFSAGPGWDACTGLGSPNIPTLTALLATSASTRKPVRKREH